MTEPRSPAVAGLFYPADPGPCARAIERCLRDAVGPDPPAGTPVGAVVPHAGWSYSGPTLAVAVRAMEASPPETFVLFGAVHGRGVRRPAVYPGGAWATPLGPAPVDAELARAVLEEGGGLLEASEEAHEGEHSLEVLVPFLLARFPRARVLPVLVPPGAGAAEAGAAAARAAHRLGRRAGYLGSSDLTHYGVRYGFAPRGPGPEAHRWSKEENDRDILDRALAFDAAGVERSARERTNACGPGAIAAAVAACRAAGADRAVLLRHTTSAEVTGESAPDVWVGYAAVLFLRD